MNVDERSFAPMPLVEYLARALSSRGNLASPNPDGVLELLSKRVQLVDANEGLRWLGPHLGHPPPMNCLSSEE